MFNMLIVEDEFIQAQHLVNCISKEIPNIRLYNIATTGQEAIQIIDDKEIDIILLDLKLPDMLGSNIINYISEKKLNKYKNSIIIISGHLDLITKLLNNPYVFSYNFKGSGINLIINNINKLLNIKSIEFKVNSVQEKINVELSKMNFNFSYIGTTYLSKCIFEAFYLPDIYNINLQKDIYPIIAKKYNKSINNVKSNINKATNCMYYDCDENILKNFFDVTVMISKPTPKEIITTILKKIKKGD